MRTARVLAALLLALTAGPVLAASNHEPLAFTPVQAPRPSLDLRLNERYAAKAARSVSLPAVPEVVVRPSVGLPANPASVVLTPKPRRPVVGTNAPCCPRHLSGVASWYCGHGSRCTAGYPGGLYAAIRRDLLGHRGHRARVCAAPRCVVVTVIDCNCGAGANLIDLYSDAFARLAPLSRGRVAVTLTWVR